VFDDDQSSSLAGHVTNCKSCVHFVSQQVLLATTKRCICNWHSMSMHTYTATRLTQDVQDLDRSWK